MSFNDQQQPTITTTTTRTYLKTQYSDFTPLTAPDFAPSNYANTLILATHDASDATIDLSVPLKKAEFMIEEVESMLCAQVDTHYSELIDGARANASLLAPAKALSTPLETLQSTHTRLRDRVHASYDKAAPLLEETRRLQEIVVAMRVLVRYLYLARRIEGVKVGESGVEGESGVQVAMTVSELNHLLRTHPILPTLLPITHHTPHLHTLHHALLTNSTRTLRTPSTPPALIHSNLHVLKILAPQAHVEQSMLTALDAYVAFGVCEFAGGLDGARRAGSDAAILRAITTAIQSLRPPAQLAESLSTATTSLSISVAALSGLSPISYFWREAGGECGAKLREMVRSHAGVRGVMAGVRGRGEVERIVGEVVGWGDERGRERAVVAGWLSGR